MKVRIELMGRPKVSCPNFKDLTPLGSKVVGLLALLCVADGEACSREWLQNKLWSDRGPVQSQDSLRQALSSLKKSLGQYQHIVLVKRDKVAIDRSKTLIDLFDDVSTDKISENKQFLSGVRIKDKKFLEWHSLHSTMFGGSVTTKSPGDITTRDSCIGIGILPIVGYGADSEIVGQVLFSRLTSALLNTGIFSIYDYSRELEASEGFSSETDVLLLLNITVNDGAYLLSLKLTCISDKKVLWSAIRTIDSDCEVADEIFAMSYQLTDQIANVLSKVRMFESSERHRASKYVLGAIDNLFSLSNSNLDGAERALIAAIEIEPKGVYYAWYAYLMVFRYEELKGEYEDDLKCKALNFAEIALAKDGNNSLTLGLVAHVYSFIFRDFNRAEKLLQPAIRMSPDSIVSMDSYAMLNFYKGEFKSARLIADKVLSQASFSPYRYCFATSLCMIDTVMGNFTSAIHFGEEAISLHRTSKKYLYGPTLRYLAVAHAETGNDERASQLYRMLSAQEPKFCPDTILEAGYPMPNPDAGKILHKSLVRIEEGISVA